MDFKEKFKKLTGNDPFPWQEELYKRFMEDDIPSHCSIPTGLGKTSVIAIWLIAFAEGMKVPRRLVYVVNRRTVVDQTTEEAIKLRNNSEKIGISDLRISTLRGQFADNREWSADPSRPAIICGTVDMIGSRLLFSGYGCGFKTKPLHAGFLGQDALLIHDEAHLEPAFQQLIESIEKEQKDEQERSKENIPWPKLQVMALSATTRNSDEKGGKPFELTEIEQKPPEEIPDQPTEPIHYVWQRLKARKKIVLKEAEEKKIADTIATLALFYIDKKATVLIYVRRIEDVTEICKKLKNQEFLTLTGTIRGKERDDLIKKPIFKRFFKDAVPGETVYLVCTSAGEVGIDISADHMICDITPFDSMAQRFGRVNRYGEPLNHVACIDVIHPKKFGKKDKDGKLKQSEFDKRCEKTLELLKSLDGDASPLALMTKLDAKEKIAAFTPLPTILPATDILFDAWSMTTIHGKMPGRPPVEPYLHGISEWEPPVTYIAWREEVEIIDEELRKLYKPKDLLEDYPLKPHELLRDRSDRVFKQLQTIPKEYLKETVWIIDTQDQVNFISLDELISKDKSNINWVTVVLPPRIGGLTTLGTFEGSSEHSKEIEYDVADEWYVDEGISKRRIREWKDSCDAAPPQKGMRLIRIIDTKPDMDDQDSNEEESNHDRFWHWYIQPRSADDDLSKTSTLPVKWDQHTCDVVNYAKQMVDELLKDNLELHDAVIFAAKSHDLGKKRERWQRSIGNPNPNDWYAKSGKDPVTGKHWVQLDSCSNYRHEFGSLLDILNSNQEYKAEFDQLSGEMKDVVLHLIASHHGYARPHFPSENAYDPNYSEREAIDIAIEISRRFACLQRKYGRWGLAYLESLLRTTDYAASANPSVCEIEKQETLS